MKNRLLILGVVSFFSTSVFAAQITQFSDPDLITIYASENSPDPVDVNFSLPTPPVEIVKTSDDRYAFMANNKLYWVSGVDVETSDRVQVESLCNSTQLATDYESSHFGIRGAGIGCKK